MNVIARFYPGDEATLFVVNVLAQVTAAGLLALLARRFLRKASAPTRHGVYLAALTWILLSPLAAYVCQKAGVVLVAIPVAHDQVFAEHDLAPVVAEPFDAKSASLRLRVDGLGSPSYVAPPVAAPPPAPEPTPRLSLAAMLHRAVAVAIMLWGLGMFYFLARLLHGLAILAFLRRDARSIHDERLDAVRAEVCEALGVPELPPLVSSQRVGSPIAIGIIRPMVVLPVDLLEVLDAGQLRDVLIHECAHVLRRDHVIGLLQRLAEMLFWPHPLVHLLNREMAQAREEVCDNHVLLASRGPDYARTLLTLAECTNHYHFTPATSGLLGPRWRLVDRVQGILDEGRKRMICMNRFLAVGLAVAVMTTALVIAGTRLIGATAPQGPAPLVPDKLVPDKKGEKPMPPAVPPISQPVEKNGLSITIAPMKAEFAAKEPLGFVITLKNVSKEAFMLFDADWPLGYALEIIAADGGPWLPDPSFEVKRMPAAAAQSKTMQPGAVLEIKLPLDKHGYNFGGNQNMLPRPREFLDPGKYTIRARHQFTANKVAFAYPHKHWAGKLATNPVEFTIAAQKPAADVKGAPDSVNGLSISVKSAKAIYKENDPKDLLTFTVTFKNVSNKTLLLYNIDETMGYKVEFNRVPAGGPWVPAYNLNHNKVREAPKDSDSRALAPGATLEKQVVMNGVTYDFHGEQLAKPPSRGFLEAGKYRVTIGFTGIMNPAKVEWKDDHWVGQIRTAPGDFTIGNGNVKE